LGNVIQAGNRMNPARQAALNGGLPVDVPALTVNRVCGSGAQAIVSAANEITAGFTQLAVAGGMENMDRAPYLLDNGRFGYRMGNAEIHDSMLRDGLDDAFSGKHSGWHTEDLVTQMDITREAQDRFAERSQQRFAAALAKGLFAAEIVGVDVKAGKQNVVFNVDEQPRPDTTFATLSKLRPAFRPDGTITAGNAPGLNSGAAAMLVADRAFAERKGIEASVRLVAYGIAAVEPGMFGLGPVPAVQQALDRAGWKLGDLERIEINEAFAAVPIAVARKLGLPDDVVNPEGGAIAHGHAIGATGAVLVTRLVHAMKRDGLKRAMVTLCIGGGQGIALALESV
jgi:acetyl-CoA C-acetyltransferase